MSDIYFSKSHEYVRVEGDTGMVGISKYASSQLGDIVFVELPDAGKVVQLKDEAAVVESVKAASEVYAPLSGEITSANEDLADNPALVNEDPEGRGWFFKIAISDKSEVDGLMNKAQYDAFIGGLD